MAAWMNLQRCKRKPISFLSFAASSSFSFFSSVWIMENKKHWCRYWRVKNSNSRYNGSIRWIEKCKCGRIVIVDCKLFNRDSNSPTVTKAWFNSDGEFEKETGIISTQNENNHHVLDIWNGITLIGSCQRILNSLPFIDMIYIGLNA